MGPVSARSEAVKAVAEYWAEAQDGVSFDDLVDAVFETLSATGHAVVALPPPHEREDDAEVTTRWEDELPHMVDVWDERPTEVELSYDFEPSEPLSPRQARYLGGALIAAADLAEAKRRA